jgi:hypothetical protein
VKSGRTNQIVFHFAGGFPFGEKSGVVKSFLKPRRVEQLLDAHFPRCRPALSPELQPKTNRI